MNISSVDQIRDAINDIPPIDQVATQIMKEMENPFVDLDKIHHMLQRDPAITSKILTMANSAYYSRGVVISSLKTAIRNLGLATIRNMMISLSTAGLLTGVSKQVKKQAARVWEHSLTVAYLSSLIADKLHYSASDDLFIQGLLHDIGRMVILLKYPEEDSKITETLNGRGGLAQITECEMDILGFTHQQLGSSLLTKWNFPQKIVQTAQLHHDLENLDEMDSTIRIVCLADAASHKMVEEPYDEMVWTDFQTLLGIDTQTLDSVSEKVRELVDADKHLFGL